MPGQRTTLCQGWEVKGPESPKYPSVGSRGKIQELKAYSLFLPVITGGEVEGGDN